MTVEESGKAPREPPERGDALNVPLPFDVAVRAALETDPPPPKKKPKRGKSTKSDKAPQRTSGTADNS